MPFYDPAFPSLAYADALDNSQQRFDPLRSFRREENSTNLAEFSFIKNMKEVQSKEAKLSPQENMFDFDVVPVADCNPFAQGLFRSDSEQDRLFASQAQLMQRASSRSHRSNHSRPG